MKRIALKKYLSSLLLVTTIFLNISFAVAVDTTKDTFVNGGYFNNIMNNQSFIDTGSMSVNEIQTFLQDKGSVLANVSPSILGDGANNRSAAQIIYDAARGSYAAAVGPGANGDWHGIQVNSSTGTISPKLILTYLEKEEGLITSGSASQGTLDCAMGYEYGEGCASMFINHPTLKGFSNQVGNGAWQLRYNYGYALRGTKPTDATTHYIVGENTQLYGEDKYNNPGQLLYYNPVYYGPFSVTMANAATAAAYSYTNYVFDSAYNVRKIFNNWFSATPDNPTPSINDAADYSQRTYSNISTIGGSKATDVKVYFQGQLIEGVGGNQWQITIQNPIGTGNYTIEYRDGSDNVVATKKLTIVRNSTADINGDGLVDIQDLSIFSNYWGQNHPGEALTDINGDGTVDILDLSIFASNWAG